MMWDWLKRHRRKVAALVVALVPLTMVVSSAGADIGQETSVPTRFGGAVVGAVQSGLTGAVSAAGNLLTGVTGNADLAEENEELHRENERLREEKSRLIGVLQENSRLRELVGFQQERPEFELAPARVVGRDLSPYFRVEQIRLYSEAELEARMPVVAPDGVVGQIHRVYDGYADVVLIADPRSRIDAISQRNRALGVVEGLGHDTDYRARMAYMTERDELHTGDQLVTSGMGGVFPRELRIGSVVEVEEDEEDLFQNVVVEPAVDFSRLEEVFVITDLDSEM